MAMAAAHLSSLTALCETTCRLRSVENAGTSASSSSQGHHHTKAVSHQSQPQTFGTPPRYPPPSPPPVASQAATPPSAPEPLSQGSAQQPSSQGSDQQPDRSSTTEQPSSTHSSLETPARTQPEAASRAGSTPKAVQLVLDVSESSRSVHAVLSPVAEAAAEDVRHSSAQAAAGAAVESHGDDSAAACSHQADDQQSAESASHDSTGEPALGSGLEHPSLTEMQVLLTEERKKTAALIGKTLLSRKTMSSGCSSCSSPSQNPLHSARLLC